MSDQDETTGENLASNGIPGADAPPQDAAPDAAASTDTDAGSDDAPPVDEAEAEGMHSDEAEALFTHGMSEAEAVRRARELPEVMKDAETVPVITGAPFYSFKGEDRRTMRVVLADGVLCQQEK